MKRIILGLMLALSGCDSLDQTEQAHIQRALHARESGDLRSSVIELKTALQKNPENLESRLTLGRIYIEMGDGVSAEKEFKAYKAAGGVLSDVELGRALLLQNEFNRILAELPAEPEQDKADIDVLRGLAYLGLNQLNPADKAFQKALNVQADFLPALLGQARLALAKAKTDEAQALIDRALKQSPHSAEALSLSGDIDISKGRLDDAEKAYSDAISNRFDKAQDRLKRALIRIELKRYDAAKEDLDAVDQTLPMAYYVKGLLNLRQKRYAEAQSALEQAVKQNYPFAAFYLGAAHYGQGHLQQAEESLNQFSQLFPGSVEAQRLLGEIKMGRLDFPGAEAQLKSMIQRNSNDFDTLNLLGQAYLSQGKLKEATQILQQAIALQPDSAQSHAELGWGFLMQGQKEQAIQSLENAIRFDPMFQQADLMLILAFLSAHDFDKALEASKRLHEKQPKSSAPLILMGGAYLGKDDPNNARQSFEQALIITPGDPNASHNLAVLNVKAGQTDAADASYQQALKRDPGNLFILLNYAEFKQNQGDLAKTRSLLEQALDKNPKALEPRLILGDHYLRNGQARKTMELLSEMQQAHADHPELLRLLGEAYLKINEPASAVSMLESRIKLQPDSAEAYYDLASAHAQLQEPVKARAALGKALVLKPDHGPAQFVMAYWLINEGKLNDADLLLQKLKKSHPDSPGVSDLAGDLAIAQKKPQIALALFDEAGQRDPNSSHWPLRRAELQAKMGDWNAGALVLEKWLNDHPDDQKIRFVLANQYMLNAQMDKARSMFARLHEQLPDNVLVLNNLAWLMRDENSDQALIYAKNALDLAPQNAEVMDTLAQLLLDKKKLEEGLRYFRKAVERDPNNLNIQFHLAKALASHDAADEARSILEKALSSDHSFSERKQALALLDELNR